VKGGARVGKRSGMGKDEEEMGRKWGETEM